MEQTQDVQTQDPVSTPNGEPSHVTNEPQVTSPEVSFVNGKYQNASELEKGYINLQSKLGSFTGAPDDYELNEGIDIDADDPLLANIKEIAKNGNMNNEMFNELIGAYTAHQDEALKAYQAEQMKLLGENAEKRLENIKDWTTANLGENAEALQDLIQDAKAVMAIESMIEKTKAPAPAQAPAAPSMDKDKILEMQMATDKFGNRRMDDPAYQKQVEQAMREYIEGGGQL